MGVNYNPKTVTDGLVLSLDAANIKSYPGSGSTWRDLVSNSNSINAPSLFNASTKTFNLDYAVPSMTTSNILSYSLSSQWTTQMAIYPPTGAATSWNFLFGSDFSQGGYWMFHGGGVLALYSDFFNSTAFLTYTNTYLGSDIPYNKYTILSITCKPFDINTYKLEFNIYLNGVFKETVIHTGSSRTSLSLQMKYIGSSGGRSGQYNLSQINNWSRVLSTVEIQQNFNAIRGRYGI